MNLLLTQEMKIGISENSIFSVFHSDAADLFNVCSNLEKVCVRSGQPREGWGSPTMQQPGVASLGRGGAVPQCSNLEWPA